MGSHYRKWQLHWADLGACGKLDSKLPSVVGHEVGGKRPVLIIQEMNGYASILVVIPSTRDEERFSVSDPKVVELNLKHVKKLPGGDRFKGGFLMIDQIRCISATRIWGAQIGEITDQGVKDKINIALERHLGLGDFES